MTDGFDFSGNGGEDGGYGGAAGSSVLTPGGAYSYGMNLAASAIAPSSPVLAFILGSVLGGGFQDQSDAGGSYSGNDPFTDSWNPDSFTGNSYADPFTTQADDYYDPLNALPDFPVPAADNNILLASDDGPRAAPRSLGVKTLPGEGPTIVPTSWGPAPPPLSSDLTGPPITEGNSPISGPQPDATDQSLGPPSPDAPPSPTPTATGQPTPTPPVTPSAGGPAVPDYNPTAWIDAPNVYIPPSPPPIDTWPTAGLNAPPITSAATSTSDITTWPMHIEGVGDVPQDQAFGVWGVPQDQAFKDPDQVIRNALDLWTRINEPPPPTYKLSPPMDQIVTNAIVTALATPLTLIGDMLRLTGPNAPDTGGEIRQRLRPFPYSPGQLAMGSTMEGVFQLMAGGPAMAEAATELLGSGLLAAGTLSPVESELGTLAVETAVGGQTGTAAIEGSVQEISAARSLIERITHQPATDAMIRDFLMFRNAYNEERASMELNGIQFEGFDEYIVPGGDINIGMLRGSRAADFAAANELAGIDSLPPEYVWHHHPDFGRMVAIDRDIHEQLSHWGGVSIWKQLFGVDYR